MKREERNEETGLPIISTPGDRRGNGKRFLVETVGKALGAVLAAALLGFAAFVATGRAYTIYGLPPRVDALEAAVARPRPMTDPEVAALAAAIVRALPSPEPRKGKP